MRCGPHASTSRATALTVSNTSVGRRDRIDRVRSRARSRHAATPSGLPSLNVRYHETLRASARRCISTEAVRVGGDRDGRLPHVGAPAAVGERALQGGRVAHLQHAGDACRPFHLPARPVQRPATRASISRPRPRCPCSRRPGRVHHQGPLAHRDPGQASGITTGSCPNMTNGRRSMCLAANPPSTRPVPETGARPPGRCSRGGCRAGGRRTRPARRGRRGGRSASRTRRRRRRPSRPAGRGGRGRAPGPGGGPA